MIKVQVIENFHLGKYDELVNVVKKTQSNYGYLRVGDIFECTEEMYNYLTKTNIKNRAFVKLIEYIPVEKKPKRTRKPKIEK